MKFQKLFCHLKSFLDDNNPRTLLSDFYGYGSVLPVTRAASLLGLRRNQHFFVGLNVHFHYKSQNFVLDKVVTYDDLVYVWHAKAPNLPGS